VKKFTLLLKKQKIFRISAAGTSMLPLLWPEDVLFIKKILLGRLKINDIALIEKGGRLFAHRIIYKGKKYLVSKGDNNMVSDGKITQNNVLGLVYKIKRGKNFLSPRDLYLLQSTIYFQEIARVTTGLEKNRIDYVILKGLPVHLYYEKSQPRRFYADCDILVEKKNKAKIERIFQDLKYLKKNISEHKMEFVAYKKTVLPVVFDIHFEASFTMTQVNKLNSLYPQKSIDGLTKDFLETRQRTAIQNQSFYLLSLNNQVLYLALHFFHHNFRGTFRLALLDMIVRHSGKSRAQSRDASRIRFWTSQNDIIKKYKLGNFVYPVFFILKKYFQTPIPTNFLKSITLRRERFQTVPYNYVNDNILTINIFDEETRVAAGATRFKNLFFLSPRPFLQKILVFFNPKIAYLTVRVLINKLRR
jgi:signal peptidase I